MKTGPGQARKGRRLRALAVNLALAVGSVAVLLVVVEATLRLSGFSYVLYPEEIEFGQPNPILLEAGFREDPDLFWTPKDYESTLSSLRGAQPPLLLLGDSCTYFGHYDRELAALASQRLEVDLRWGDLSVPGWSSYQGLQQLRRDVPGMGPTVITIYFGWNDHWIGFGIEDKNVARVKRVFGSHAGWLRPDRFRIVQLATQAVVAWGARETDYPERVALGDFRANLRAMVRESHELGAIPVLLTAPSGHRQGEEPPDLTRRWLRESSDLVPLHRAYVRAVREVAAETGAPLCDLASRAEALPWAERSALFTADGIHLSPTGDVALAHWLFECFERDGLWPALSHVSTAAAL